MNRLPCFQSPYFKILLVSVVLLSFAASVSAGDTLDVKSVSASPSGLTKLNRITAKRPFRIASFAVGAVSATTLAYFNADENVRSFVLNHSFDERVLPVLHLFEPLGRGKISHWGMGTFFLAGTLAGDYRLQKTAVVWVGSFLMSDVLVQLGKGNINRYRPNQGRPSHAFGSEEGLDNRSFPSQHSANAFVAATVIASVYKDKKWVAPLCYGAASLVAMQRVMRNAHWTSDVIAGAAVGYLSAKTMLWLFNGLERRTIGVFPVIGKNTYSLSMILVCR